MQDKIQEIITRELQIKPFQTEAVIKLIDEGNTIPFIARYRKEATGNLNDEVLRAFDERLEYLRNLWERKNTVLSSIEEQGKLTEELKKEIEEALTLVKLEDIYRPYKQKRRTRAVIAKEKGLLPFAAWLVSGKYNASAVLEAEKYIDPEKGVNISDEAIAGACDIIAESISDNAAYRQEIRRTAFSEGIITTAAKDDEKQSVYEMYYGFSEPVRKLAGHRTLAIDRGEKEKFLTVKLAGVDEKNISYLKRAVRHSVREGKFSLTGAEACKNAETEAGCGRERTQDKRLSDSLSRTLSKRRRDNAARSEKPASLPCDIEKILDEAAEDAYKRLIFPSVENEVRGELTEKAQAGAIKVFSGNLKQLLMQPPIAGKTVLGWDPAFRTGCKLAVVDCTGKVLHTVVIYPTAPQNKVKESIKILTEIIEKYKVDLISVGNGTASRESEKVIVELLKEVKRPVQYVIVNEAGASVYSVGKVAAEEFPEFDVGQRSAASIARRLQDPLSELVKIDPKSIGVGQYQHDLNQAKLGEALTNVVEDCVNSVGADLNTASAFLLEYISGINKTTAKNIVKYREENGSFKNLKELLKVPKLGPKAFEQAAGFLRISDGDEPLDKTAVHPESYKAAKELMKKLRITPDELKKESKASVSEEESLVADESLTEEEKKLSSGNESLYSEKNTLTGVKNIREKIRNYGSEGKNKNGGFEAGLKLLSEELGVGELTLNDIVGELEKPGRDPREAMPKPVLKTDVLEIEDLRPGMILKGTVRNVIDFGAFVDIGVHQDGLVHISELSDKFVKHPMDVVKVGDIVEVRVILADPVKKKIALSMKLK